MNKVDTLLETKRDQALLKTLKDRANEGCFNGYEVWLRLGMGLKAGGFKLADWQDLSHSDATMECESKWDTFRTGAVTKGTLYHLAWPQKEKRGESTERTAPVPISHPIEFRDRFQALEWFNLNYFKIVIGRKPMVLQEGKGLDSALRYRDFKEMHLNKVIKTDDKTHEAPDYWLKKTTKCFSSVVFDPNPIREDAPDVLNLWRGLSYKPKRNGKAQSWLTFIKDVICSCEQANYDYLLDILATIVQRPHDKSKGGNIAVVLQGKQGTGKSFFVEHFAKLFPKECFLEAKAVEEITGRFNAHLVNKIIVFSDEAVFGGDKQTSNQLKNLITASRMPIEAKYMNMEIVDNFLRFFFATNNDWGAPVESGDRRYFVLKVSDNHRLDRGYFQSISDDLDDGGYEDFLSILLNRDIATRDFERDLPMTKAKKDSLERMRRPIEAWYTEILNGMGSDRTHFWFKQSVNSNVIYQDYIDWCKLQGKRYDRQGVFTPSFEQMSGLRKERVAEAGSRSTRFDFKDIPTMRSLFNKSNGVQEDWED